MDRSITPFKVAYALSGSLDEPDLDDGDYAELSDNTDLFLTQYFTEYFAEEPTEFREVEVLIQKTNDPLVVRYFVTASFAIPGNVPTMRNLFDRMDDAFSGEASRQFVSILNEMGSGNPFRNTRSVALINDTPVSATGTGSSGGGSERSPVTSSLPKLISIILGAGVLALVVAGLVWVCRKVRGNNAEHVANAGDDKRRELNVKKQPENLTSESRTIGYLQKIRNRYRDDGGSKTDLEEVSLDDYGTVGVDHGMLSIEKLQPTIAAQNQERATELRVPVHRVDFMSDLPYPAPPSDDGVGDDDDNDTITENQQLGSRNSSDDGYLSYLDMKTSFEEEDLRG